MDKRERIVGCLLGGAVGDAIGLPYEGLSREAIVRRGGAGPLRHALIGGRGMLSDDTEHACMTAQALLAGGGDPRRFMHSLAWRLRGWLLGLPAGIGLGTLRALIKLWCGWSPAHSGVNSAGNGPAMRAAILGACLGADEARMVAHVERSTRMTHRDPRALAGALAVARAAAQIVHHGAAPAEILERIAGATDDAELRAALELARAHHGRGASPADYAAALGQGAGVSGYIHHTVPIALYCWLSAPTDLRATVEYAVRLGGDTDTVAAIAGGLTGASVGAQGVPADWLWGLWETPRSPRWIVRLAGRAADACIDGRPARPLALCWPLLIVRNLMFTMVVLGHGFSRLLRRLLRR
jgi:ADP-ribosylglycohydrolase